ncbi:S1 RNA-binding domain-containing protein, partial [bacterium]|nr:S1 RNA-binding domain-containing protein [bacterium]
KEWQIGAKRANQLVQWLCDPFGDSDSTGDPPAVLSTMPSIKGLKQGDAVVGVVVGVMPFGVFVELAPDCSGLVHVSRVSDTYVEDLHEAVQVGDVVTAWVTGIDEKRRRVALSAVSPQREAELEEARRSRDDRSRGGQGGQARGGQGGQARGGQGGQARGGQGGQARGGQGGSAGGGRGRDQGRGGRPRDGGRGRGARGREKKPESYRVVGKKESKPISDAMQKGDEPLRSFGDLMQFYSPPGGAEEAKAEKPAKKKKKVDASKPADDGAANSASPTPDAGTQAAVVDTSGADTGSAGKEMPSVPAQSAEPAKQVEPAPQIEPTPPTAEQDGSDSTQASDKPAS